MAGANIVEIYSGQRWTGTTITYSFIYTTPTSKVHKNLRG